MKIVSSSLLHCATHIIKFCVCFKYYSTRKVQLSHIKINSTQYADNTWGIYFTLYLCTSSTYGFDEGRRPESYPYNLSGCTKTISRNFEPSQNSLSQAILRLLINPPTPILTLDNNHCNKNTFVFKGALATASWIIVILLHKYQTEV